VIALQKCDDKDGDDDDDDDDDNNKPGNHEVKELQKTAILGTAHILRRSANVKVQ